MFQHILLPTDGSPLSDAAVQKGIQLAASLHARVTGLHVVAPFQTTDVVDLVYGGSKAEYDQAAEQEARQYLARVEEAARAAGVPCETTWVAASQVYQAIIQTAQARGCDCIAMASHGRRGVQGFLLGSETARVLTHTRLPVVVFR
jgi:nucleotide-binding universal stress UspA family protein